MQQRFAHPLTIVGDPQPDFAGIVPEHDAHAGGLGVLAHIGQPLLGGAVQR